MDFKRGKIPNRLLAAGFPYVICFRLLASETSEFSTIFRVLGSVFLWMFLVFIGLYPFFKIGALGAGDIKLYMLTAAFLGGERFPSCMAVSLLLAAGAGIGKALVKRSFKTTIRMAGAILLAALLQSEGWY